MSLIRKGSEVYYNYSNYFEHSNFLYGITPRIRKDVEESNQKQKDYLKNTFIMIDGDVTKMSLFDISSSANIQPARYHGEIWNRVTALRKYADYIGFSTPVFMTITPKTEFKPTKQIEIKKNVFKLYNNKNFSGSFDYVDEARKYISEKWTSFTRERLFRDIKKAYGENVIFMRTYEPHIDGTPHAHLVAYIPPEFKDRFVELAKGFFVESRFDIKTEFDARKGGVVSYILKYILKSFENAKNGTFDEIACWYAHHKIRRFSSSRTLIPLQIFRRIQRVETLRDIFQTTLNYKKGNFEVSLAYHPFAAVYSDLDNLKNQDYKICSISFLVDDGVDTSFQVIYQKSFDIGLYVPDPSLKHKIKRIEHTSKKSIPVQIVGDKRLFIFSDGKLIPVVRSINNYSKWELLQYYYSLTCSDSNYSHFAIIHNECIRRGLIDSKIMPLNRVELDSCDFNFIELNLDFDVGA